MDFKNLNQKTLAAALGVSVRTVQKWDCPRHENKNYSLSDVFQWRLKMSNSPAKSVADIDKESKKNLSNWRAEKAKQAAIERRRLEGSLIELDQVEREVFAAGRILRDSILSIPYREASILMNIRDPKKFERKFTAILRQVLVEVQHWKYFEGKEPKMNTPILENKFYRLIKCLQDAGKDPDTWIIDHLKKKPDMDAADTLDMNLSKRDIGPCQKK